MAGERPRILFLFVDGLGLGERSPEFNPVYSGVAPTLARLLDEAAIPIDAALGVPGLPQSATGQTALLTGVNAPRELGRHLEGFPNEFLKKMIREHNVYAALKAGGLECTFANAYYIDAPEDVHRYRRVSVTTVAALAGIGSVRMKDALHRNEAVYHDLTRAALTERGYAGPFVTPEESAGHLLALAEQHDFTLFEYFMTDRLGHRGTPEQVRAMLSELDRFLAGLLAGVSRGRLLLVMTSDHGNVEDSRSTLHTANPVPFVAQGFRADELCRGIAALTDVVPGIRRLFDGG